MQFFLISFAQTEKNQVAITIIMKRLPIIFIRKMVRNSLGRVENLVINIGKIADYSFNSCIKQVTNEIIGTETLTYTNNGPVRFFMDAY
jgi:hypothetical protein